LDEPGGVQDVKVLRFREEKEREGERGRAELELSSGGAQLEGDVKKPLVLFEMEK
jgi:hypothetical protein